MALKVVGIRDRHPHIPATLVPRNVQILGECGGLNLTLSAPGYQDYLLEMTQEDTTIAFQHGVAR